MGLLDVAWLYVSNTALVCISAGSNLGQKKENATMNLDYPREIIFSNYLNFLIDKNLETSAEPDVYLDNKKWSDFSLSIFSQVRGYVLTNCCRKYPNTGTKGVMRI